MVDPFNALSAKEKYLIFKAPYLVAVLIAGADDNIDLKENESALLNLTFNYQTFVNEPRLDSFYEEVTNHFVEKLTAMIKSMPPMAKNRNPLIAAELEKLNEILPKIESNFAFLYYESLLNLALEVAKASGGFMGIGSISPEENEWIKLNMIQKPKR